MPALSSCAPNTSRPSLASTIAPAHWAHGSRVTKSVQSSRRSVPSAVTACWMASNSAWAVGSLRATVVLCALETTTPSRVTTAPTGTSSSSIASLAWASAASIPARSGWSGTSRFRRARRHSLEAERIAVLRPVHPYPVAFGELPLEHGERQWILQQPLDRPLERPRAVHRVVAFRHDQLLRRRRHLEGELALRHEPLHALDLEIDDARDVLVR